MREYRDCVITNPVFCCRECEGRNIEYREVESSCGGYDDVKYRCKDCGKIFWHEGSDY